MELKDFLEKFEQQLEDVEPGTIQEVKEFITSFIVRENLEESISIFK